MRTTWIAAARRLAAGLAAAACLVAAPAPAAGLFAGAVALERARAPEASTARARFLERAAGLLGRRADPFAMDDVSTIRFGKGETPDGRDDTLTEAVNRLTRDSAVFRDLALAFALTGRTDYAAGAEAMMLAWARRQTVVNVYDFAPDFAAARIEGQTEGFHSDRPWNFALDAMWQAYGLINAADAYLLLRHGGRRLDPETDAALRDWILRLTEAVNSSLHAWTKWADLNAGALGDFHARDGATEETAGVRRHRSDNHLSWALAGLLAGAAALSDEELAAYVLDGGAWTDRRAGSYANPSPIRDVIERAIEGAGEGEEGRVFEERIGRSPRIGYALFHLQAMSLVARVAELHFGGGVWSLRGEDGAGLAEAYRRYAPLVAGRATSPDPDEADGVRGPWLAALAPPGFGGAAREEIVAARRAPAHLRHVLGPVRLLFEAPARVSSGSGRGGRAP